MSELLVTSIYNQEGEGAPSFPKGATVTGVITATSFSGSGANLTGIDATALKDDGGVVKIQANSTGAVVTGILTTTGPVTIGGTLTYEDVTNIDSVGLITARDGLKVTGGNLNVGTAITAYGSTGIVSATSYRGDGSQLSGIEAAPTIQGTASGAIAAEKSVYVKSDGTVAQVVQSAAGFANNEYAFEDGSLGTALKVNQKAMAYDVTKKVILCVYSDPSNNNYHTAVAGTVSSLGVITWGTPVKNPNDNDGVTEVDVCWDSYAARFVSVYRDNGSTRGRVCCIDVSGTTVTFNGSVNNISGNENMSWISIAAFPQAQRCMVVYRNHDQNYKLYSRVIVGADGATPNPQTYGGTEIDSENCVGMRLIYDPDANRAVLAYASANDSYKGYIRVATCGSTAASWNSRQEFTNNYVLTGDGEAQGGIDLVYSEGVDKAMVVYEVSDGDNDRIIGRRVFSVGSSSVTFTMNDGYIDDTSDFDGTCLSANPTNGEVLLTYSDWEDSKKGKGRMLTINSGGTAVTVGSEATFNSSVTGGNSTQNMAAVFNADASAHVVSFTDNGDSNKGKAIARIQSSTEMTPENFIGFSKEAYTNGQTATIKVVGNITTQSGLTPGQKYYVQQNGTLGLTASDPNVEAGKALSATSLLITG